MQRVIVKWFTVLSIIAMTMFVASPAKSETLPIQWEAAQHFQFNIQQVSFDALTRTVTVYFSVTDPTTGTFWDILNNAPFKQGAASTLRILIGWNTTDYQNTGSANAALSPIPYGNGAGVALPISINALKASSNGDGTFRVQSLPLPPQAGGTGVVGMEGHPAYPVTTNGIVTYVRAPVKNTYQYFAISGTAVAPRREVVEINKCKVCHDGALHAKDNVAQLIPRLTLHGENRTEELHTCVICHNPDQTDIPYRTTGAEVSIDFKRMVHSIHGASKRSTPFTVTGYQGTLYDFSTVVFPGEVRDCMKCHIEVNGKGTYELPLAASVLGSTVVTGSVPGASVDVNPANDRKITPTAAVCSSCHDSKDAKSHMSSSRQGGNFNVLQSSIDSGTVKERCVECHGPGREKDIKRIHQVDTK